jgi:hypothetical protein
MDFSFFNGGIACVIASIVTHPIDTVKVRLQLRGEWGKAVVKESIVLQMIRNEGLHGFFRGLSASMLREASYSTIRMGFYDPFKKLFGVDEDKKPKLWKKILAGGCSGLIGSAVATPTDLIKVRFQASAIGGNASLWGTAKSIYNSSGIRGLYRGIVPTTQRAIVLTASQLSSYDESKRILLDSNFRLREGFMLHFWCSVFSGFCAATASSPIDVVKSRMMNSHIYTSSADCFIKTMRSEGISAFFKGWLPNWMRLGPHTCITFVVLEQLRAFQGLKPV